MKELKTLRQLIEDFTYEHLEHYVSLVAQGGEDTVIFGVRALDDPEKFTHGALVNAATALFLRYKERGDRRAERTLALLNRFLDIVVENQVKTWGKLALLRAMAKLHKAGMLGVIPADKIKIIKEKTDYEDFFDKEKLAVRGYPTNYTQVAMACAGLRELLGWDSTPVCAKISEKLVDIMQTSSDYGYMDEDMPMGRFDRYSILVSSEFSDTMQDVGGEIPAPVLNNLAHSAKIALQMANERGDGINYGRSLSCHGDGATLEVLSSAFARGLIDGADRDTALLYCVRITEKILNFWYDKERKSFNIWWDGRSTNRYRQVHRVLEVNLDMANHLLTTLANFELAGLADTLPRINSLPCPEGWIATDLDFIADGNSRARTVILRHRDIMAMLPLIGVGKVYANAAYQPYPAICGVVEGAPEAKHPYLIPEYKCPDGSVFRPIQFYTDIKTEQDGGAVRVSARGNLAKLGAQYPERTEHSFTTVYRFEGNEISASFETDLDYTEAQMTLGRHGETAELLAFGFDSCKSETTEDVYDFFTPSGRITEAQTYTATHKGTLSYRITLK